MLEVLNQLVMPVLFVLTITGWSLLYKYTLFSEWHDRIFGTDEETGLLGEWLK